MGNGTSRDRDVTGISEIIKIGEELKDKTSLEGPDRLPL